MGGGRPARPKSCDYVLVYRNTKLAAVEAKADSKSYTKGVGAGEGLCRLLADGGRGCSVRKLWAPML